MDATQPSITRVLFVCLGNICRSPLAQGVFESLVAEQGQKTNFLIDSAGVEGYHVGEAPDIRAQQIAAEYGIDISQQKARKIQARDFTNFDYILAADLSVFEALKSIQPHNTTAVVKLFLSYLPGREEDPQVPDPYYGGMADFEAVLQLTLEGCQAFYGMLCSKPLTV